MGRSTHMFPSLSRLIGSFILFQVWNFTASRWRHITFLKVNSHATNSPQMGSKAGADTGIWKGGGLIIIFTRGQSPRNQRLFIISSSKFFTNMCNKYSSLLHAHNTQFVNGLTTRTPNSFTEHSHFPNSTQNLQ